MEAYRKFEELGFNVRVSDTYFEYENSDIRLRFNLDKMNTDIDFKTKGKIDYFSKFADAWHSQLRELGWLDE
jgi:hypothetical protein